MWKLGCDIDRLSPGVPLTVNNLMHAVARTSKLIKRTAMYLLLQIETMMPLTSCFSDHTACDAPTARAPAS